MHYHFYTLNQRLHLDEEAIRLLKEKLQFETLKKGSLLLRPGQICNRIYFLEEGLVRTFYEQDGQEHTTWFYEAGSFLTSWYSFYSGTHSFESLELLEDGRVYSLSRSDYQGLQEAHPQLQKGALLIAEESTAFLDYTNKGFVKQSARERYESLLSYLPDLELRCKLSYIASFLGVSQETLSRIRAGKL